VLTLKSILRSVIPLRFDVIFYAIGIICFTLAVLIIPFWGVTLIPTAFMIVLLLFGLFFVASGYSARPRKYKIIPPAKPIETEKPMKKPEEKPLQQPPQPIKPPTELAKIKGIGPKRIVQLNALQIMSVEDLTRFSVEDLADKLKISRKTTAKWIEQARDLLKEPSA
jgi:predicted flap endonuclease-1-like 5' DNA nuclease